MPPGKRGPGSKESRGGAPRGAPAGVIGRLISGLTRGDRPYREAGHGCGVPHQRLSALCPLGLSRGPSLPRGATAGSSPGANRAAATKRYGPNNEVAPMLSDLPPSPPIRLFRPRLRPGKTAAEPAQTGSEARALPPEGTGSDAPPPPVAAAKQAEARPPE